MTAEVVVMNRLGVALASDSAASVSFGSRTKLYHADKLFMLSRCRPVAVMVFNSSALLNVPWETIIKSFRAELGDTAHDHLSDYAGELIGYLNRSRSMFPADVQRDVYLEALRVFFTGLQTDVFKEVQRGILDEDAGDADGDSQELLRDAARRVIGKEFHAWEDGQDLDESTFPPGTAATLSTRLSAEIYKLIVDTFPYVQAPEQTTLTRLARLVIQKQRILPGTFTGVVIAGFGEKEHFPVMQSLEIGGIYDDHLKYNRSEPVSIDAKRPALIQPFAQSQAVETFLYGVNPNLYQAIIRTMAQVLLGMPQVIIDGFPGVGKKRKAAYKAHVAGAMQDAANDLFGEIKKLREEDYLNPVLASIAHLPKSELASIAAALVNHCSFQKRVSSGEDETVGGPVDVAVITKGDGFVWVERKHYFRPELNSHYFRNRDAGIEPEPPGEPS